MARRHQRSRLAEWLDFVGQQGRTEGSPGLGRPPKRFCGVAQRRFVEDHSRYVEEGGIVYKIRG